MAAPNNNIQNGSKKNSAGSEIDSNFKTNIGLYGYINYLRQSIAKTT